MRKFNFVLIFTILITLFTPIYANATNFSPSVDIYSESVYLYNMNTDQVLYSKNENAPIQPGTLVQIMTAILVFEQFKDNPEALKTTYISAPSTAFDDIYLKRISTADFRINEEASYYDLLHGLLLQNAYEAANIIAYNIGNESIPTFVRMMNEKATEIGAKNTYFVNPHGLYNVHQKTTAKDMALILKYAYDNFPLYKEITTKYSYTLEPTNKHSDSRNVYTKNSMIKNNSEYKYSYITSGTASTLYKDDDTGCPNIRNLATTASKDGTDYLLVTLNAPVFNEQDEEVVYSIIDHKAIYDWAFNSLEYTKVLSGTEEKSEIKVLYGKESSYVLLRSNKDIEMFWPSDVDLKSIEFIAHHEDAVVAPVKEGDKLGTLELKIRGETFATTNLYAASSVDRDEFKFYLQIAKQFPHSKMFKNALLGCLVVFLLYTILYIVFSTKKPKSTFSKRKPTKRRKIKHTRRKL